MCSCSRPAGWVREQVVLKEGDHTFRALGRGGGSETGPTTNVGLVCAHSCACIFHLRVSVCTSVHSSAGFELKQLRILYNKSEYRIFSWIIENILLKLLIMAMLVSLVPVSYTLLEANTVLITGSRPDRCTPCYWTKERSRAPNLLCCSYPLFPLICWLFSWITD